MKLNIEINLDDDTFKLNPVVEVARILRAYSLIIENSGQLDNYPLFNWNGVEVGKTTVETEAPASLSQETNMFACLLTNVPAGLAKNHSGESVPAFPYLGKTGKILDENDSSYDTDQPTGYEPTYYLIDFGDVKLWIPYSTFIGHDGHNDRFEYHLKFVKAPASQT